MFATAKDCCLMIDIFITMIEQTFNSLFYHRCRNALMARMGVKKKVKDIMSENKDLI